VSNLVKGVQKVFKKTVQVVKKIAPYVAMAAAIYFTAGIAMAAFPATASFAAAMPGITGAASALGIGSAGTAVAAASEAAPTFAGAAEAAGLSDSAMAANSALAAEAGVDVGAAATAAPIAAAAAAPAAAAGPVSLFSKLGGFVKGATSAVGSMSFSDKLLLATVGAQTLGNYLGPTADEVARDQAIEKAKFRGSFYGMDESGVAKPGPQIGVRPMPGPGTVAPTATPAPTVAPPMQANASAPRDLFAPRGATNLLPSIGGAGTQDYSQFASNANA
jgi:hypothetical protein